MVDSDITKVLGDHPLGTIDTCAKRRMNPSSHCRDISVCDRVNIMTWSKNRVGRAHYERELAWDPKTSIYTIAEICRSTNV